MNRADFDSLVEETSNAVCQVVQRPHIERLESDEVDQLHAALATAQASFPVIGKNSTNPHFRSSYSGMDDVKKALSKPLGDNNLSVTVQPVRMDGEWVARGVLRHKSGQWIAGFLPLMLMKRDMQALKSAMTYAQRTLTISLTGAASGDDDDGNAACEPAAPAKTETPAAKAASAMDALRGYVTDQDETGARKVLAKIRLREGEKALPKGTAAKAQKLFDDCFAKEIVSG